MRVLEDKILIKEAAEILGLKKLYYKYFNQGSFSRVILLNNKYVVKTSNNYALKAEVEFLDKNNNDIFPKIVYVDNEYDYYIYEYIEGDKMCHVEKPLELIQQLKSIVESFVICENRGFGYVNEELDTWKEFLNAEIEYSKKDLDGDIKNEEIVYEALNTIEKFEFTPSLLHGDFGTHNFIQIDGKLSGIIDPMPVIGDKLYDLLFAIVSNIDIIYDLELETLFDIIDESNEKIKAMLIIVLYVRIGRCKRHHIEDLDKYKIVWDRITK